jgi:CSLREA domain-containing protein
LLAIGPATAGAATITPDILTDEDASNSSCSLREAVTAANTDGNYNGCVAVGTSVDEDDDTITLQSGQTYGLSIPDVADDNANLQGDLDVLSEPLTIEASGSDLATIDGNGSTTLDRVLDLAPNNVTGVTSVTLNRLRITDGGDGQGGGGAGIRDGGFVGPLAINESKISGNNSPSGAANAIRVDGQTTITNTSIFDNTGAGAAIFHEASTLTVIASTINGNTHTGNSAAGGIAKGGSSNTTTVINSTISGNSVQTHGGGIAQFGGTLNLINATIAGNTADSDGGGMAGDGGGLYMTGGTANVQNTIVAHNIDASSSGNVHPDCSGTVVATYSLIEARGVSDGCTLGGGSSNNLASGTDPMLDALDSNGGPTDTHALLAGSPAIGAGNPATPLDGTSGRCAAADQRGQARGGAAGTCDIGAFEAQPPVLAAVGDRSLQAGQTLSFSTSATDPDPIDLLTFGATNLPAGASFDAGTHAFSWTPSSAQVGSFPGVLFSVGDGTFSDSEAITITVTPIPSTSTTAPTTAPTATGLRAVALRKCKKRFPKGPRRTKCIKRAKRLPV